MASDKLGPWAKLRRLFATGWSWTTRLAEALPFDARAPRIRQHSPP